MNRRIKWFSMTICMLLIVTIGGEERVKKSFLAESKSKKEEAKR